MDWDNYDAALFDLDGVITPTAEVHMRAWEHMFASYFASVGAASYTEQDYFSYLDGKPRYDGVRSLLTSRDITLPEGDPADPSDAETVCGLGNRKNDVFAQVLHEEGVSAYAGSVQLLDALQARGTHVAIVSSSANARPVLRAAGILQRFDVIVDGIVAKQEQLRGKPAGDTFAHAAAQLGIRHERTVVLEDALSGVAAGRDGGFALVIGVDRGAGPEALRSHGADLVVRDLAELLPGGIT